MPRSSAVRPSTGVCRWARASVRLPCTMCSLGGRRLLPCPHGVHFVTESIGAFAERLRTQAGKNVWMMGGGEIIGSFLDEDAIDEFIITVVPTFIGEGIPLLAPRHRAVTLRLLGVQQFPDDVVQLHYEVQRSRV